MIFFSVGILFLALSLSLCLFSLCFCIICRSTPLYCTYTFKLALHLQKPDSGACIDRSSVGDQVGPVAETIKRTYIPRRRAFSILLLWYPSICMTDTDIQINFLIIFFFQVNFSTLLLLYIYICFSSSKWHTLLKGTSSWELWYVGSERLRRQWIIIMKAWGKCNYSDYLPLSVACTIHYNTYIRVTYSTCTCTYRIGGKMIILNVNRLEIILILEIMVVPVNETYLWVT